MTPVWIIDLGAESEERKALRSLLETTDEALKPYWHYSAVQAEEWRALREHLVTEGRTCYNAFVQRGYNLDTFHVAVLGCAEEGLTQNIFAPLAGLLRDDMPRIISDHTNRGVEITGLLYIPSTINQSDNREQRVRTAMLLEQLNTLCQRLGGRHYSHVVAYEDVQWKGNRYYPRLDEAGRAELLFQLLASIYIVGEGSEGLFDTIGQPSGGIFSLGAASVYYNSEQHRIEELQRVVDGLATEFRDSQWCDEKCSATLVRETLEKEAIAPESVAKKLRDGCSILEADLRKMEGEADPHPVWDLLRVELFPKYYRKYLKYMPARLTQYMQSLHYVLLTQYGGRLRQNREQGVARWREMLHSLYRKTLLDPAARYATIAQMEGVFSCAKEELQKCHGKVAYEPTEVVGVPEYLKDDYTKCLADEEGNKPAATMEKIKKNLRREPVVLSLAVRCLLLGMALVMTVLPILHILKPVLEHVSAVFTMEWLWITVLMVLPFAVEFLFRLRRHFKRVKRLRRRMLAAVLVDVNRRLSQMLAEEARAFYEELAADCEEQLQRLSSLRECSEWSQKDEAGGAIPHHSPLMSHTRPLLPFTRFNQPLLKGSFCGQPMVTDAIVAEAQVRVNDRMLHISQLEQPDRLALLKTAFRHPEALEAVDMGAETDDASHHAGKLMEAWTHLFGEEIRLASAEDVGLMITRLDNAVDMEPMYKMAGVNGMLFSVASNNPPILRVTHAPRLSTNVTIPTSRQDADDTTDTADAAMRDYALLITWQRVSLQSQQICNCQLQPLPELTTADRLTLYYAFYRQRDLAYTLAGQPLDIAREEMETLDKQIIGG